jgi:hypothetical protein
LRIRKWIIGVCFICLSYKVVAQQDSTKNKQKKVTIGLEIVIDSLRQQDIINILKDLFNSNIAKTDTLKLSKTQFSLIPAIGYSLSTGFAFDLTANVAFFTNKNHKDNFSVIDAELVYDTQNQKIFASRSEIWFGENNFKFTTDLRAEQYPVNTYGLGTTANIPNTLDYNHIRVYSTIYKKINGAFYFGVGYNYDSHFDIHQDGNADKSVSQFTQYGFSPASISSGYSLTLLFDNRRNHINPLNGGYGSLSYRDNLTLLGSDSHWQSFSLDLRKYYRLSSVTNNVLAFWALCEFTTGNVPYLDLPSTATDTYHNSGRGYAAQRFRGKNELYLEAEYRFRLTRNGLIGGVLFTNAESFSEFRTNQFVKIAPAAGAGLRIKINKQSNTNVGFDYAYGINNSRGLFVNLGEYF